MPPAAKIDASTPTPPSSTTSAASERNGVAVGRAMTAQSAKIRESDTHPPAWIGVSDEVHAEAENPRHRPMLVQRRHRPARWCVVMARTELEKVQLVTHFPHRDAHWPRSWILAQYTGIRAICAPSRGQVAHPARLPFDREPQVRPVAREAAQCPVAVAADRHREASPTHATTHRRVPLSTNSCEDRPRCPAS